ncbi:hypothetical protein ACIQU4_27375 [Streptomyces sp. NPDC090741]|uniref:hypothetical protein n=1 Tax=Streptomyces sp. NPDC090741 TaxID=3365967 RepID=UPI0037F1BB5F
MPHPLFPDDQFPAEALPDYPEDFYEGDGFDWIRQLPIGWKHVPQWGADGWDLGAYPYIVVAHYDCPLDVLYGVATFTEGDVTVSAWGSREARDAETDEIALGLWHDRENAPADLPAAGAPAASIPARFRGPYTRA